MQPGSGRCSARLSSLPDAVADAVDVHGRPEFVNRFQSRYRPIPASAVRVVTPERERRTTRPERVMVYLPTPPPEMLDFGRCFAYAYITAGAGTAAAASSKADPAAVIRRAIQGAAPRARFELHAPGSHGSDATVRFCSPEDREAAMEKQPFPLLDGGSVRLVREGETSNVRECTLTCVAHVALLQYPKEQRNLEDIQSNCSSFGHLLEIDPDCYDAPDLSPVRVVLNMEHPREIPREVRIRYFDRRYRNVVPVQILRIWDLSADADDKYVPIYSADPAPAVVP